MTANQIEYWKLQETKRHNTVVEEMDRPVKEAQSFMYTQSGILSQEQSKTQETVRALNLAQKEAAEAAAETSRSQAYLNYEKANTEQYNQNLLDIQYQISSAQAPGAIAEAEYNNIIQQERLNILNDYPGKVRGTAGVYNFTDKWGFKSSATLNLSSIVQSAISLFK